jgi:hypothetical protein
MHAFEAGTLTADNPVIAVVRNPLSVGFPEFRVNPVQSRALQQSLANCDSAADHLPLTRHSSADLGRRL